MTLDYDLRIIQETRDLARKAKEAQTILATFSQEKLNEIIKSMSEAVVANAEWLARMACDETKYGIYEHKIIKNTFAAKNVYEFIKDMKTAGCIHEDSVNKVYEYAVPVGVIMGIIPTTNPTSTLIHNAMCAVKSGNAIVFSPHPSAVKCSVAAAQVMMDAAARVGAPDGIISCLTKVSMEGADALMHNDNIDVIVATGGPGLVKAAYSAGKPALGVGAGNVPAFIERTADVKKAVTDIVTSKTFDNGMICASEQSIIADLPVKDQVLAELKAQGCYILNDEEAAKVAHVIMTPTNGMDASFVGKTAVYIAEHAGVAVPAGTKLLIAPMDGYGAEYPLSHEKLTTVLGFYCVKDWHDACELCYGLLNIGGVGHSLVIHSQDDAIIREFAVKPVSRILVNTPASLGGIGYTTGISPSLTLGCGTCGGSSLDQNLTPLHLINVKRLAYGICEPNLGAAACGTSAPAAPACANAPQNGATADVISDVVRQVLSQLQSQ
ncbi:MAG: acetaldehyde dehydrogenase (acetylating) [Clostridiales bacterium]